MSDATPEQGTSKPRRKGPIIAACALGAVGVAAAGVAVWLWVLPHTPDDVAANVQTNPQVAEALSTLPANFSFNGYAQDFGDGAAGEFSGAVEGFDGNSCVEEGQETYPDGSQTAWSSEAGSPLLTTFPLIPAQIPLLTADFSEPYRNNLCNVLAVMPLLTKTVEQTDGKLVTEWDVESVRLWDRQVGWAQAQAAEVSNWHAREAFEYSYSGSGTEDKTLPWTQAVYITPTQVWNFKDGKLVKLELLGEAGDVESVYNFADAYDSDEYDAFIGAVQDTQVGAAAQSIALLIQAESALGNAVAAVPTQFTSQSGKFSAGTFQVGGKDLNAEDVKYVNRLVPAGVTLKADTDGTITLSGANTTCTITLSSAVGGENVVKCK